MPRYIDADKLKTRLLDAKHRFCKNQIEFRALPLNDKARVDAIDNLISIVINFPTTDVIERKKGKWIPFLEEYHDMFKCSNCGNITRVPFKCPSPPYYYCPNCGAEMETTDEANRR